MALSQEDSLCVCRKKTHEKILTCAPLFVEGGGKGGDCRGREPNVAGFQARRALDCAPTLLKRQRREQISRKNKKRSWMHPPKKEGSSPSVFSSTLEQAINGCGCACCFFCASVKAIECHWRSSRVNKVNHMPYVPYLSRASRSVFGCGFRFFGLSPSSPR